MSIRRTTRRGNHRPISPLAVELFVQMQSLKCTCDPVDWNGKPWQHEPCSACHEWWALHADLHNLLNCRPWEWPCIRDPAASCPYPPEHPNAKSWEAERRAHPEALELFAELSRRAAERPH
jgi:hypothetical protein